MSRRSGVAALGDPTAYDGGRPAIPAASSGPLPPAPPPPAPPPFRMCIAGFTWLCIKPKETKSSGSKSSGRTKTNGGRKHKAGVFQNIRFADGLGERKL
tara:strand:- start:98 stop:394 length:297 start_codon:yes stop_codon:yes gene_type:complete